MIPEFVGLDVSPSTPPLSTPIGAAHLELPGMASKLLRCKLCWLQPRFDWLFTRRQVDGAGWNYPIRQTQLYLHKLVPKNARRLPRVGV